MEVSLFGTKIKQYRRKYAMTQRELADSIGVEPEYIANVERGRKGLRLEELMQICNLFHIELSELLPVEVRDDIELREQWVGEIVDVLNELNTGQLIIVKAMVSSLSAN